MAIKTIRGQGWGLERLGARVSLGIPDWDLEQLEVILEPSTSWQHVTAGPGAGKSAVACQRVAYLIDEGIPPTRILLISFTRTAVAELRDRIVQYALDGASAGRVRISTIDSHAWSLRIGFDDQPLAQRATADSYDLSISQTVDLFRRGNPELLEFMTTLEHLIIDEAQDIMGLRADLILEVLRSLTDTCGVTILSDPAQAIYGFTTDDDDDVADDRSLLERLTTESPRPFMGRSLRNIHRVENTQLVDLFLETRKDVESESASTGHVERVLATIRALSGRDVGLTSYPNIAEFLTQENEGTTLVLFRRRADVLFASSYCSQAGIEHRLRLSGTPHIVKPWIGWLFGEATQSFIEKEAFHSLWQLRGALSPHPFATEDPHASWALLHRLAAGHWPDTLDLEQLRRLVTRTPPPIEFCQSELGYKGPILGTIHASKGREADTVVLVMPSVASQQDEDKSDKDVFEEGRVYYVGATRARKMLVAAGLAASRVGYLDSKRIYRAPNKSLQAQLEIGRIGDMDPLAHLAWSTSLSVQRTLADSVGTTTTAQALALKEHDYAWRLVLDSKGSEGVTRQVEIGQLSASFDHDLSRLWGRIDSEARLRPGPRIPYLYLVGVSTIGVAEVDRWAVKHPFNQGALALAPVIKGFAPVQFLYRKHKGTPG